MQITDSSNVVQKSKEKQPDIFDSVFKTLLQRFPRLAAYLINEVFHTQYAEDEMIVQGRNEYHDADNKVINDSTIRIRDKIYHIECQSTRDGMMIIRMIEYDFKIALEETRNLLMDELKKKPKEREKSLPIFQFPRSCIVYVRPGLEKQNALKMEIVMPDGQKVLYKIPVVQAHSFSKEEIFKKKLLILVPFYILRYEKEIRNGRNEILDRIWQEYTYIREQLINEGNTLGEPRLFYDLALLVQKILDHVGEGNKKYKERMDGFMGGVILEMESDKIWDEAWDKAVQYVDCRQQILHVDKVMKKLNMSLEEACDFEDITVEEYEKAVEFLKKATKFKKLSREA